MQRIGWMLPAVLLMAPGGPARADVILLVRDPGGAAARTSAPVSVDVDLAALLGEAAAHRGLRMVEIDDGGEAAERPVPVQFVPKAKGAAAGRLWWLMPPGTKAPRPTTVP